MAGSTFPEELHVVNDTLVPMYFHMTRSSWLVDPGDRVVVPRPFIGDFNHIVAAVKVDDGHWEQLVVGRVMIGYTQDHVTFRLHASAGQPAAYVLLYTRRKGAAIVTLQAAAL